ncbi:MAG: hypothetical protein ACREP6_16325 [Candidatus Binataceae bacterium]
MNTRTIAILLVIALAAPPISGWAFDGSISRTQPAAARVPDETAALRVALGRRITADTAPFIVAQRRRHRAGESYIDFGGGFEYMPAKIPNYPMGISVRLAGIQYGARGAGGKSAPTGELKYLVLTYALKDKQWAQVGQPAWQSYDIGAKKAGEMARRWAKSGFHLRR